MPVFKEIRNLVNQTRRSVEESMDRMSSYDGTGGNYVFGACDMLGESFFPDADLPEGKATTTISWRGNPRKTHSDWTIVVSSNEFDARTYHVHKTIMSDGPYCSKYFAQILDEQRDTTSHSQPTRIALDEQDANTFPIFLDYVYNNAKVDIPDEAPLGFNSDDEFAISNAVSLRHLARIFECSRLTKAVNKFIQKDMSPLTGPAYLAQAFIYRDDSLIEGAKRLCIDKFLDVDPRAFTKLSLPLFQSIIKMVIPRSKIPTVDDCTEDYMELSYHVSDAVCQYFEKHPKSVNVKALLELTDESVMPMIAPEPAIGFTAIARELDVSNVAPTSQEWKSLILLCQRCADAVVGEYGWNDFNVATAVDEYVQGPIAQQTDTKMDSLLFATSFAAALERAQRDSKKSKRHGSNEDLGELKEENEELRSANRRMKKDLERYKRLLAEARDEVSALQKQTKGHNRR